ncbi:MAG: glycosyltransferase family 2 protein [Solirubrobacteraceae bacterium]
MASDSIAPVASIVVPTRGRPAYLEVALASLAPQALAAGGELIVVDDAGASEATRALCERYGARYEPHPRPLGLNVARNSGVQRSRSELVVFVDDDVEVREGWLAALLDAAREHPETEVFTGPIHVRLEGAPPHSCGREPPPITSLQLGPQDGWTRFAWGSNMAIRRSALERVGPFDVSLEHGGDEQELQERLAGQRPDSRRNAPSSTQSGAMYVAAAALDHRRAPADARLRPLCRAAYARGRAAWRFDAWRGQAPSLAYELRILAGCVGHVLRRRCPMGLTMVAHSSGRLRERLAMGRKSSEKAQTPPVAQIATGPSSTSSTTDDFLSGESGTIGGLDELRRAALDIGEDGLQIASGRGLLLTRAARHSPPTQRVLALCVERPQNAQLTAALSAELAHSRHRIELRRSPPGDAGKFENLNRMLADEQIEDFDWFFVLDDDIGLPHGFMDKFLFLAERFSLDLAQPAHRAASHAAWRVTRRRLGAVTRETRFVEIGPVTAFARRTYEELLPFPQLRMGWGLDLHWAALAAQHGWRCGVIDAVAIAHRSAPAASAYSREQALGEARAFLRERPYLRAAEAQQTLVTHRHW